MNWQLATILGLSGICGLALWAAVYYCAYAVRSQVWGRTVWRGRADSNAVALTFDDGPTLDTLDLLDILRREKIKATFFLIGKQVERYPEIARRIAADNHEIGNHSYSHPIYLFRSPSRTRLELQKTQNIIMQTTGVTPRFSRPPCGVRTPAYFAAARELGLETIQWSDTGFDWKDFSAAQIAQNVLKQIRSGSIILLHDGDSAGLRERRQTVEAVPLILQGLNARGLRIVSLAKFLSNDKTEFFTQEDEAALI